jgi:hypothetical protein
MGHAEPYLDYDLNAEGDLAHVFGLADSLIKASTNISG